jgi:uncharacterized protein
VRWTAAGIGIVMTAVLTGFSASAENAAAFPLPVGAHVVAQTSISRFPGELAVEYQVGSRVTLAVLAQQDGKYVARWTRSLGKGVWKLSSPGPAGLFRGLSPRAPSGSQRAFAYLVKGSAVVSALQLVTGGVVRAGRGVVFKKTAIVVRKRDSAHAGSVAYRIVTQYDWSGKLYVPRQPIRVPDYPTGQEPRPSATIRAVSGSVALIRLEIADTEPLRETGLMFRQSLDPDSGMIFVWQTPTLDAFWMKDTPIPLSIAWISTDLKIVGIQEMAPLDQTTLHSPGVPYLYAIEANKGYFTQYGIRVGDSVQLHLR